MPKRLAGWKALGVPPRELHLDFVLPTGQSFRWRKSAGGVYTGVVGSRVVQLKQTSADVLYREASRELCTLPGIGPKVAACACLFSLDKHEAIPVDTHVWQVAKRYYTPELDGKSLTKKVMEAVEDAFIDRFGDYAGWAHNTLFIAELASYIALLPENLRTPPPATARKGKKTQKGKARKID